MAHPLHRAIGKALDAAAFHGCELVKARECGGKQNIPLFVSEPKSNATEYCNVDLLVLTDGLIRAIVEIEEANIKPTQILGKFLASALARLHHHAERSGTPVSMAKSVLFVQVADSSSLPEKSSKPDQFKNIETSIRAILPLKNSAISEYRLFSVNGVGDTPGIKAVVSCIAAVVCALPT